MKKFLLLLLVGLQSTLFACDLCVGHDGERLLRKRAAKFVQCDCNCYAQGVSKHVDGHRCVKCGHRVLPYSIKQQAAADKKGSYKSKKSDNPWQGNRIVQRYQESSQLSKIDLGKMFLIEEIN